MASVEIAVPPPVINEDYVADVKLFGKWSFEDVAVRFFLYFFHHVVLIDLSLCFVVLLIFRSFFSRSIMLFYGLNCFHITYKLQLLTSLLLMEVNLKVVI